MISSKDYVDQAQTLHVSWWKKIKETTNHAINTGSLLTLETQIETITENNVEWVIRTLSSLKKKSENATSQPKDFNPFAKKYIDNNLLVCQVNGTHNLMLNKFNIAPYHFLMTTIDFEPQESPLNLQDFRVSWFSISTFRALGFFNCGPESGASQPHKHMQFIPLPLEGCQSNFPFEPLLQKNHTAFNKTNGTSDEVFLMQELRFKHVCIKLRLEKDVVGEDFDSMEEYLLHCYQKLIQWLGLDQEINGKRISYNLLFTEQWMFIFPRANEKFVYNSGNTQLELSINSVGMVGTLLVKSSDQMEILKQVGPMKVLESVCFPLDATNK